jgi:hypothetical protein
MKAKKMRVQSKITHAQHDYKISENKENHGFLFDEAVKLKKAYSFSSVTSASESEIDENTTESSSSSEYDEYAREDLDALNFYHAASTSSEENRQSDSDSYDSYKKVLLSNYSHVPSQELVSLLNYQEGNSSTEESQLSNTDNVETSYSDSVDSYGVEFWPPVEIIPTYAGNVDPVDKSERKESHIKDLHNKSKLKNREKHLAKLQMQEKNKAESDNKPELVQKNQKAKRSEGFFDRRQTKHQEQYHEVRKSFTNG